MSDVPIQTYLFPLIMVVVVGFMVVRSMKMRSQFLSDNPQYAFGPLAQRWQLQLTRGDPAYNLFINSRDTDVAAATPMIVGMSGDTPAITAHMAGQHREHPVQFEFYDQTHVEKGIIETTYTRTFRCVLSVGVRAQFPPFEIVLRNENQYLVVERQLQAPEQRFGQFALDQTLVILSPDPNIGAAIAPVVGALTAMTYVHVCGSDGSVRVEMSPLGSNYGVYYAETILQVLLAVADILEGRPYAMPAPPPPPQQPR